MDNSKLVKHLFCSSTSAQRQRQKLKKHGAVSESREMEVGEEKKKKDIEVFFSYSPRSPARPAASYLTQSTFEELPDEAMVAANASARKSTSSGIVG